MDGRPDGAPLPAVSPALPEPPSPPAAPGLAPEPPAAPGLAPERQQPGPAPARQPVTVAVEVVAPPEGTPRTTTGDEGSHRGIALLLAAAAIAAAIVAALSSSLASQAGDAWQTALRLDAKRAAAATSDIQLVYQSEVPQAVAVLGARLQEARLREAAATAAGPVAAALMIEADAQQGVASAIGASVPLVADDTYLLPGGARNLSQRLADRRAETPDLVAVDPYGAMVEGDALAAQASMMTIALWPLAVAALLGALAEPFRRQRRPLLALGAVSLGLGVLLALTTGVLG